MPMDKKIYFAIVGCGNIGRRHAENLRAFPQAVLHAVIDISPESIDWSKAFGVSHFPDLDAYLQTENPTEVFIIATPNGEHTAQALRCLEAKRHVVIEKPMSLSRQDAEKVIFKALQVHRHVFVVMQNRYGYAAAWLRQLIDNRTLGDIYMVQVSCYWNRDERYYKPANWHGTKHLDGGTLYTQFSHFIDMLYWLFGDIQNIRSRFSNFSHQQLTEFEDSGIVNFEFINGGIGSINFSTSVWNKNMESSMTVIASHGSVKIGGQYMEKIEYCHIKDYTLPEEIRETHGTSHMCVIQNVLKVIEGKEAIATNALEGLKVVEMIERIYAAPA